MGIDSTLVGAAGEHLVLSRLLSKGFLAAQAPRGTRKADILVNNLDGKPPCLIQVKTRSGVGSDMRWILKQKHEEMKEKDLFYCFVDLSSQHPSVYVVPAKVVASVVTESHSTWLATPGKAGKEHKDSDMRSIKNHYKTELKSAPSGWMDKYLENWEILN